MIAGVIGVGKMGKNHVRIYNEIKEIEKVLIYDTDKNKVENLAKILNAEVCDTLDVLINRADIVSICTPTSTHYKMIKRCLKFKKHTFVEKPMALNYSEGLKVLEMLKGIDIKFGVGHIERFNPIVTEILKLSDDIIYVDIMRHNPSSVRVTDSSVVEDLMIHDIDIIFNVIVPNERYTLKSAGNKNVMHSLIKFESGKVASLSASRLASKKIRRVYIECKDLTLEGDYMYQEVYLYKKPNVYTSDSKFVQENVIEKVLVNKVEPLKVELKTFIDCVEKNETFPVTAEQALKNLKVCEEIWSSSIQLQ